MVVSSKRTTMPRSAEVFKMRRGQNRREMFKLIGASRPPDLPRTKRSTPAARNNCQLLICALNYAHYMHLVDYVIKN